MHNYFSKVIRNEAQKIIEKKSSQLATKAVNDILQSFPSSSKFDGNEIFAFEMVIFGGFIVNYTISKIKVKHPQAISEFVGSVTLAEPQPIQITPNTMEHPSSGKGIGIQLNDFIPNSALFSLFYAGLLNFSLGPNMTKEGSLNENLFGA